LRLGAYVLRQQQLIRIALADQRGNGVCSATRVNDFLFQKKRISKTNYMLPDSGKYCRSIQAG
jgi:hypothetical protein